jgi:hypothetical protein
MMGITPPPHSYANHDSDDEDDSGGFGCHGDGVDKKLKIPAKIDAPINLMRKMASKFFN